jgi:hypothetical protein
MKKTFSGKIFLLFLFFFLGFFSFYSQRVWAAEMGVPESGVQVSPVRFDWNFNSGEERTGVVNLKNYSSDASYAVEISVEDFYVTDDATEARFFIPDAAHPLYAWDVINWIELPADLTLAPNEGRDVFFKVKVPQNAPTGGYYGALFFKSKRLANDGISQDSSKVIINQRVGILLVMAVKGAEPINLSGKLSRVFPEKRIFWDNPAKVFTEIFNDGNLHYKLLGKLKISKFGREVDSQEIGPRVAYPGKGRNYENSWQFGPWAYGFYRVNVDFWSEDLGVKLAGETSFWVIPWKTTVAIVLLVLIIWSMYRFFNKNFEIKKKKDDDEDEKQD